MISAVVDTSVVVKWFSLEREEDAARRLRDDLAGDRIRLLAPDLILYELANALCFHPRFQAGDVVSAVDSVVDIGIHIRSASAGLIEAAVETAYAGHLTIYDAVFAALAAEEGVPLITADEKLAGKIGSGCKIIRLGLYTDPDSIV